MQRCAGKHLPVVGYIDGDCMCGGRKRTHKTRPEVPGEVILRCQPKIAGASCKQKRSTRHQRVPNHEGSTGQRSLNSVQQSMSGHTRTHTHTHTHTQAPKKRHKHKESPATPLLDPHQGAPDPCKFFMFGAFFPFKTHKNAQT